MSNQYLFKLVLWINDYCVEENKLFFFFIHVASIFASLENKVSAVCEFKL